MNPPKIIDLTNWQQTNLPVGLGTRRKVVIKPKKKSRVYFLAKTFEKDIGELRSEVCAFVLGKALGFSVQRAWLCKIPADMLGPSHASGVLIQLDVSRRANTAKGQFNENLRHGAALISNINTQYAQLGDDLRASGRLYTLDAAVIAMRDYASEHGNSQELWDQFFELFAFDAIIGGTDRHGNNWGVLEDNSSGKFLRMAPAFDNGTSLLWKMESHGPKFTRDLLSRHFLLRAKSMFRKTVGGERFTLFDAVKALHTYPEYKNSSVAKKVLLRLQSSTSDDALAKKLLKKIPISTSFETSENALRHVGLYATMRLRILIDVLRQIS